MKRVTSPPKLEEELSTRLAAAIMAAPIGRRILITITKDKPHIESGVEPLSKDDLERLRKLGDSLAQSLKDLANYNMKPHVKTLLDLQWWAFAQQHIYAWDQYVRFMERDGVMNTLSKGE